jgi:hypothetical protein
VRYKELLLLLLADPSSFKTYRISLSAEPTSSFFLFPGEEKPLLAPEPPHSSLRFMRLILLHNLLNLAGAHTLWILCQFGGWWQAPCIASDATTQGASVVLLIKNERAPHVIHPTTTHL